MKKIGLLVKESAANLLKQRLSDARSVVVVNYANLTSAQMSSLRLGLKKAAASLLVVKNNVAMRVMRQLGMEEAVPLIEGPCGIICCGDEPPALSAFLVEFAKNNPALKIKGGFFAQRLLSVADLENIARLPSRNVLLAQTVAGIKAPLNKLVMAMKGNLNKLVLCLGAIKDKKEKST